jgi:hypothetical protein
MNRSPLALEIDAMISQIIERMPPDPHTRAGLVLQLRFEFLCRALESQRFVMQALERTIDAMREIPRGDAFEVDLTDLEYVPASPYPHPDAVFHGDGECCND